MTIKRLNNLFCSLLVVACIYPSAGYTQGIDVTYDINKQEQFKLVTVISKNFYQGKSNVKFNILSNKIEHYIIQPEFIVTLSNDIKLLVDPYTYSMINVDKPYFYSNGRLRVY
jgi:hypothetical protein